MGERVRRLADFVIDAGRVLRGQVLPEGAAEVDVEHLEAAADAPDREMPLARGVEQCPLQGIAVGHGLDVGVRKHRLAVALRLHVGTAAQDHGGGRRSESLGRLGLGGRYDEDPFLGDTHRPQGRDVRLRLLLRGRGDEDVAVQAASRSTSAARPRPPETQRVAMPRSPSLAAMPCSRVTRMRAPVAPMGWPSEMAPPSGFTVSYGKSRSFRQASTWQAKASLSSTSSMALMSRPVLASRRWTAGTGPMPMIRGSTPTTSQPTSRATTGRPSSPAARREATMIAAAPSVIPEALPAVTRPPSRKTGASLASEARVTPSRGCSSVSTWMSPFFPGTVTGAISGAKRPAARARSLRFWLSTAQASEAARSIPASSASSSAVSPMTSFDSGSLKPSWYMPSTISAWPNR